MNGPRDDVAELRDALMSHQLACADKAKDAAVTMTKLKHAVFALVIINGADLAGGIDLLKTLLS